MKKLMSLLAVLFSTLCLSGCQDIVQPDVIYEEPAAIIEEVTESFADDVASAVSDVEEALQNDIPGVLSEAKEAIQNDVPGALSEAKEALEEDVPGALLDVKEALADDTSESENDLGDNSDENVISEDGYYYSKDDVALYIYTYGKLPGNYITKKTAEALGWEGGSLEKFAPGMAIGGSKFGNREGKLPAKKGRTYTECDIDTNGKSKRGAKRIVFSNDGLIYYTGDHYETFELLYGEE